MPKHSHGFQNSPWVIRGFQRHTVRLRELASRLGKISYLIDSATDLRREWFNDVPTIGISAGASAPGVLVQEVLEQLREWGVEEIIESTGEREDIVFPLPRSLCRPQ